MKPSQRLFSGVPLAVLLLVVCCVSVSAVADVSLPLPSRLRVNFLDNADLTSSSPDDTYLSWELPLSSDVPRGTTLTGYRVTVSLPNATNVWDSGSVSSNDTTVLVPSGLLQPRTTYMWTVQVMASGFSSPSPPGKGPSFHTDVESGFFDDSMWIGGFNQLRTDLSIPSAADVSSAMLYATGLGLVVPSVNGHVATDAVLNPGQTVYPKRVLYLTYDVKDLLVDGDNVLGMEVGNGKYGYLDVYCTLSTKGGDGCRTVQAVLVVTMSNGDQLRVTTNSSSWVGRHGPVVYDSLYHGEHHDARLELPAWNIDPASTFPSGTWAPAVQMQPGFAGPITPCRIQPTTITDTVSAQSTANVKNSTVFDFGINFAGFPTLSVSGGKAGDSVTMLWGEIRNTDGTVDNTYARCSVTDPIQKQVNCALQTDVYIKKGSGAEVWTPKFTYHGGRFCQVTAPSGLDISVQGNIVAVNVTRIGSVDLPVTPGSELGTPNVLNRVYDATVAAQLSQLVNGIITDCPQREKRGWLGDAQLSSWEAGHTFDMTALYRGFLQSMRDQQAYGCVNAPHQPCPSSNAKLDQGSLPNVSPLQYISLGFPGSPVWEVAAIVIPYHAYRLSGQTTVLAENWGMMTEMMQYFDRVKSNGLVTLGNLGDWPPPQAQLTPTPSVSAFYWIVSLRYMSEAAAALNNSADAASYAAQADNATALYHSTFWNSTSGTYSSGSQTSLVMALKIGAPPASLQPKVVGDLQAALSANNGHITCGIVGATWIFDVLRDVGLASVAVDMLVQDKSPSFGWMVNQNATTLWEAWDGTVTHAVSSRNHIMFGGGLHAPTTVLTGIRNESPGWTRVSFQPLAGVMGALTDSAASVHTPVGVTRAAWRRTTTATSTSPLTFGLNTTVPLGSSASVWLPLSLPRVSVPATATVTEGGVTIFSDGKFQPGSVPGVTSGALKQDVEGVECLVLEVGAGSYVFATHV